VDRIIIRAVISPPLAPHVLDEIEASIASSGSLLARTNDPDVNASSISAAAARDKLQATLAAVGSRLNPTLTAGRAFRFEILDEQPESIGDDDVRAVAVSLHGSLEAPVFIARRTMPVAAWAFVRPMPWGRKGLAVGQTAPTLPFGGSDCLGASIEVGAPTVLVKARLDGVPEHGLVRACAAVGGAESGFADVGAYAAVSVADGASVVVLEFGELKRAPIVRALDVLDIEARRYGGALGQTALLSHVPLGALLDTLRARTGLSAGPAHVLETHLPAKRG